MESLDDLPGVLRDIAKEGDMVVCLGAGDITAHAANLEENLKNGTS